MPCPSPIERCHWLGILACANASAECEQGFQRNHVVVAAVDEQDRRRLRSRRPSLGEMLRPDELAGIAKDRRRRSAAPQPDVKRQHGSLTEADQRQLRIVKAKLVQFGVEEGVEARRRLVDAGPALVLVAHRQREPLASPRRLQAGLGRIGREESRIRHKTLPLLGDGDQIRSIGAIAMQEHDELLRRARFRREARTVDQSHGVVPRIGDDILRLGLSAFRRAAEPNPGARRANWPPEQNRIYIWIGGIKILRSIRAAPIEPDQAHRRFHSSRDFL